MSNPIESQLCRCGKKGFTERADAVQVSRELDGRNRHNVRHRTKRKRAAATSLHAYQCDVSGLWHVGHKRMGL